MKKDKSLTRYTADELRAKSAESKTDWGISEAMTEAELEAAINEDSEERELAPDWTQARLVTPEPKLSVNLRLDREIVEFFKARGQGRGHISMMQAVLKAYVDAHRSG